MKQFLSLLVLASLAGPASAQFQSFPDQLFDESLDLRLDVHLPENATPPYPVVVWIHGGAWRTGSRTATNQANLLCPRGFAVVGIDYRLTDVATWPAQIQDCKGAIRWLRANASAFDLDPDRIGAWGSSAGGHLAACLGTMGDVGEIRVGNYEVDLEGDVGGNLEFSSRVQAVCDWFGPTDFVHMRELPTFDHEDPGSPESELVGGPIQELPDRCSTANSIPFVSPDDPPFLIMHGTVDTAVPFSQSELLDRALRLQASTEVTFFPVQDNGHGGPGFDDNQQLVFDLFESRLRDLPEVTVRIDASDALANENGNAGAFTIQRTGPTNSELLVKLWASGSATNGVDCDPISQFATIPAGASSISVSVAPLQDSLVEGGEDLDLTICPRPDYRVDMTGACATVAIADDESTSGLPVISVATIDALAAEPNDSGALFVSRMGSLANALEVRYELGGTSVNRRDYFLPGTVTIPAGALGETIVVTPIDDEEIESGEVMTLRLRPGNDYALGSMVEAGVLFAEDDQDSLPIVSVTLTDTTAQEGSTDEAMFMVTRTSSIGSDLEVPFTLSGRADLGADYSLDAIGSVTIPAGSQRVTVTLTGLQDNLIEGDESVVLTLGEGASWQLGEYRSAELTLRDDDAPAFPNEAGFAMSPLRSGSPALLSISGPPSERYLVRFALEPGYYLVPPFGVLGLDGETLVPGSFFGRLDANGTAAFALVVPDGAAFQGLELTFQAFLSPVGENVLRFSNSIERRIEKEVTTESGHDRLN